MTYVGENRKPSSLLEQYRHEPEDFAKSLTDWLNEQAARGLSLVECRGESVYIFRRSGPGQVSPSPAPASEVSGGGAMSTDREGLGEAGPKVAKKK